MPRPQKFDLNELYPTEPEPRLRTVPNPKYPTWDARCLDAPIQRKQKKQSPAWLAAKALMMAIGGMSTVAYLATMPVWMVATGAVAALLTWYALYRLLREWSAR